MSGTSLDEAIAYHRVKADSLESEASAKDSFGLKLSFLNLATFIGAVVLAGTGASTSSWDLIAAGVVCLAVFFVCYVLLMRTQAAAQLLRVRKEVHERHIMRIDGRYADLPSMGDEFRTADHSYGEDVDLVGSASLFQRIDVTYTVEGAKRLYAWLAHPAGKEAIEARQVAVKELAGANDFREQLEATASIAAGEEKLDGAPFLKFVERGSFYEGKGLLVALIHIIPIATVVLLILGQLRIVPVLAPLVSLAIHIPLILLTARPANEVFDLVAARRGYIEAFQQMLLAAEEAKLDAPLLKEIQGRLMADGKRPSSYLTSLDRWAGFAEFRMQFPLHFFGNLILLWDAHVLYRLERWSADIGGQMESVFKTLGELEALSSLSTLLHTDDGCTFPSIVQAGEGMHAEGLGHPLLHSTVRVVNDIDLHEPGAVTIITGSNMAGKSTLLRSVGGNVALALAGGPVIATSFQLPIVRLRASMRIDDSLREGASYFKAELLKLERVIENAESEPPVLFLLDELLRGTNAKARHLGARSVVKHLVDRRAFGIVATHDIALSKLEQENPGKAFNAHFTDVIDDGEMTFDYRLRDGVVKTSNALHLLKLAGIDVPADRSLEMQAAAPAVDPAQ